MAANDPTLWDAVFAAFTQLITSDVPGSLLAMSIALNFVLLAPRVVRSIRSNFHVNE